MPKAIKKKPVVIRISYEARTRLKIKAAQSGKTIISYIEELSKS